MAATYEYINGTLLGSSSNLVSFTSIPNTYTDLIVTLGSVRLSNDTYSIAMYFNNDTATNYCRTWSYATNNNGSAPPAPSQELNTAGNANWINITNTSITYPNQYYIRIPRYADTNVLKTAMVFGGGGNQGVEYNTSTWRSTSAINQLDFKVQLSATFSANTRITLWGIKAA